MSRANGEVIKDGQVVGYYVYNGTVDYVIPEICDSPDAAWTSYRENIRRKCECGKAAENVILYTDYGSGFHWAGKACMSCKVIVDGFTPYGDCNCHKWECECSEESTREDGHPLHGTRAHTRTRG